MYESVLVPTDGSEVANRGIDHALDLAEAYDATVHVLAVVRADQDYGVIGPGATGSLADAHRDTTERDASDAAAAARERGLDVEATVESGSPYLAIVEYVRDHDIDVVVMGTHGRGGVTRLLAGSVTEQVVRRSDAPVVTVRAHA